MQLCGLGCWALGMLCRPGSVSQSWEAHQAPPGGRGEGGGEGALGEGPGLLEKLRPTLGPAGCCEQSWPGTVWWDVCGLQGGAPGEH